MTSAEVTPWGLWTADYCIEFLSVGSRVQVIFCIALGNGERREIPTENAFVDLFSRHGFTEEIQAAFETHRLRGEKTFLEGLIDGGARGDSDLQKRNYEPIATSKCEGSDRPARRERRRRKMKHFRPSRQSAITVWFDGRNFAGLGCLWRGNLGNAGTVIIHTINPISHH